MLIITKAQPAPRVESKPEPPAKSFHDVLANPDSLLALTDDQLKAALAPYIPAARKAVLPTEKASKIGLHSRVMKDVTAALQRDPKIAEQLAALRAARK